MNHTHTQPPPSSRAPGSAGHLARRRPKAGSQSLTGLGGFPPGVCQLCLRLRRRLWRTISLDVLQAIVLGLALRQTEHPPSHRDSGRRLSLQVGTRVATTLFPDRPPSHHLSAACSGRCLAPEDRTTHTVMWKDYVADPPGPPWVGSRRQSCGAEISTTNPWTAPLLGPTSWLAYGYCLHLFGFLLVNLILRNGELATGLKHIFRQVASPSWVLRSWSPSLCLPLGATVGKATC